MLHEKKINSLFINWLVSSLILVLIMIIVGGLTRLTDSGLSITEWELFSGILPPLNEASWNKYFELYKKIPQYEIINPNMSMNEFKIIFYWEYVHRLLGRFIGLFFLIPLIYFYFSKQIKNEYLLICYIILSLIIIQGVVGWFMVESGLVNNTTVSHYRLAIHLTIALVIVSMIFWLILNIKKTTFKNFFRISYNNAPFQILIFLIFFQTILGAFVSGLDAGKIYQTWPLMGQTFMPNDFVFNNFKSLFEFDNHSLVQFYHRNLAYIISFYIFILTFFIFKNKSKDLYSPIILLVIFLSLQIFLGILTLISGINIYLASAHQITSVFLIISSINLYFYTK